MRHAALLLIAATIGLAQCTSTGSDRARALPADRDAPVMYVALGDSTVEGVAASSASATYVAQLHARLRAIYPAARVENLGVGGAVSADVVADQLQRAVALRPDLVTISIGPNDVTDGVAASTYEKNVDRIFGTLRRETSAVIVANLLPDVTVTPRFRASRQRDALREKVEEFNVALGRQAKKHGALIVDLYTASRDEVPLRPELIAADGYHPSDLGYARWAELMWQVIQPVVAAR